MRSSLTVFGYLYVAALSISSVSASGQSAGTDRARPDLLTADYMGNARALSHVRTRADCLADAAAAARTSDDIVVCAADDPPVLPVPEVYGPVAGSTDGAAIDPHGVPCGASISNNCYSGLDIMAITSATIGMLLMAIDPDRNLGEGTPIPERFRGANR